jgi:serine/threonine-protein kinase
MGQQYAVAEPGRLLAGRYRLEVLLGRGAMGEVWRAHHVGLGAPCAVKVIDQKHFDPAGIDGNELVTRFFHEAHAAAALRSPHVVQILDHGFDGLPYIAMELLEGETLEERLEREPVLPGWQTAEIITHVARAVGKAHEAGIIHRDLKPGNVFLVRNDDEEMAKVLDFGIAKVSSLAMTSGLSTREGSIVGTPCYMSPEQAQGKPIDHRADLWSMAIIAFECLCGQRPFDGTALGDLVLQICAHPMPVPSQVASVPKEFDAWFARAAHRNPDKRFQSARELASALQMILAPETVSMRARTKDLDSGTFARTGPLSRPTPNPISARGTAVTRGVELTHRGVVSAIRPPNKNTSVIVGAVLGVAVASGLAAVIIKAFFPKRPPDVALAASDPPTSAAPPTSASLLVTPGPSAVVAPITSASASATNAVSATTKRPPPPPPHATATATSVKRPKDRVGF